MQQLPLLMQAHQDIYKVQEMQEMVVLLKFIIQQQHLHSPWVLLLPAMLHQLIQLHPSALEQHPTGYGSITVVPAGYAHPNATTAGRSLSYFWRVSSSGFTMGSATVTHSYNYAVSEDTNSRIKN